MKTTFRFKEKHVIICIKPSYVNLNVYVQVCRKSKAKEKTKIYIDWYLEQ